MTGDLTSSACGGEGGVVNGIPAIAATRGYLYPVNHGISQTLSFIGSWVSKDNCSLRTGDYLIQGPSLLPSASHLPSF